MSEQVLNSSENSYDNELLLSFTEGVEWDKKLFRQEIKVQMAWLDALTQADILTNEEKNKLAEGLAQIEAEIRKGTFKWQISDEDIHMNIERALTEKLGDLGKKVHLGRSRNDLIATTLKLHVADFVSESLSALDLLAEALQKKAQTYKNLVVPGTTHLQHAQPTTIGHILMSHAWAVLRVKKSFGLAREFALESLPLGAAAFNGTTIAADFQKLADNLGFKNACFNSYDAVGERDAILQSIDAMKFQAVHLSKLAHDLIYWSSTPVGLLMLPKQWSTGSSIMPNKRNPDVVELIRARSNKIIGRPSHQLYAAFGSCYFSDLHELKKIYLETVDEFKLIHSILIPFLGAITFDEKAANRLLEKGHILATDYANQLVENGSSFRDAYKIVADKVAEAVHREVQIHELDGVDIDVAVSLEKRNASGGSGKKAFENQCKLFTEKMKDS